MNKKLKTFVAMIKHFDKKYPNITIEYFQELSLPRAHKYADYNFGLTSQQFWIFTFKQFVAFKDQLIKELIISPNMTWTKDMLCEKCGKKIPHDIILADRGGVICIRCHTKGGKHNG
jgi:formylmethanofuran dehydrogenase subunit E